MEAKKTDFEILWQFCKNTKIETNLIDLPNNCHRVEMIYTSDTTILGLILVLYSIFNFDSDGKLNEVGVKIK